MAVSGVYPIPGHWGRGSQNGPFPSTYLRPSGDLGSSDVEYTGLSMAMALKGFHTYVLLRIPLQRPSQRGQIGVFGTLKMGHFGDPF